MIIAHRISLSGIIAMDLKTFFTHYEFISNSLAKMSKHKKSLPFIISNITASNYTWNQFYFIRQISVILIFTVLESFCLKYAQFSSLVFGVFFYKSLILFRFHLFHSRFLKLRRSLQSLRFLRLIREISISFELLFVNVKSKCFFFVLCAFEFSIE